jgi:heme exporter protein D
MNALAAGGFDWSSAGIAVAALAGLLVVSIAAVGAIREARARHPRRKKP